MASQYLLKSIRSLRQACREISLVHLDSSARDCGVCALADLCQINHEGETAETPEPKIAVDTRGYIGGHRERFFVP